MTDYEINEFLEYKKRCNSRGYGNCEFCEYKVFINFKYVCIVDTIPRDCDLKRFLGYIDLKTYEY